MSHPFLDIDYFVNNDLIIIVAVRIALKIAAEKAWIFLRSMLR